MSILNYIIFLPGPIPALPSSNLTQQLQQTRGLRPPVSMVSSCNGPGGVRTSLPDATVTLHSLATTDRCVDRVAASAGVRASLPPSLAHASSSALVRPGPTLLGGPRLGAGIVLGAGVVSARDPLPAINNGAGVALPSLHGGNGVALPRRAASSRYTK